MKVVVGGWGCRLRESWLAGPRSVRGEGGEGGGVIDVRGGGWGGWRSDRCEGGEGVQGGGVIDVRVVRVGRVEE